MTSFLVALHTHMCCKHVDVNDEICWNVAPLHSHESWKLIALRVNCKRIFFIWGLVNESIYLYPRWVQAICQEKDHNEIIYDLV